MQWRLCCNILITVCKFFLKYFSSINYYIITVHSKIFWLDESESSINKYRKCKCRRSLMTRIIGNNYGRWLFYVLFFHIYITFQLIKLLNPFCNRFILKCIVISMKYGYDPKSSTLMQGIKKVKYCWAFNSLRSIFWKKKTPD